MRFGGKRGLSTSFTCQDPVRKSELTGGISKDGIFKRIDHSAGEAASTRELNAAKGRRGRLLKQRCPGPWGRGMARADGSPLRAEGSVRAALKRGKPEAPFPPREFILSLAPPIGSVNKGPTPQEKRVAGGWVWSWDTRRGQSISSWSQRFVRDFQQVEWWAKNHWHRREKKRINKRCGQIPPTEKRACKKLGGIQANRSHQFPSPREIWWGFPGGSDGKEYACNAGDLGSIPGSGRSPGEGNGYPLQDSGLENSRDRGVSWATVHGAAKELDRTEWLSNKEISSLFSHPHPGLWRFSKWERSALCGHWLPPVNRSETRAGDRTSCIRSPFMDHSLPVVEGACATQWATWCRAI